MIWEGTKMHKCEKLTQIGIWEGIDSADTPTSGPEVRCDECGLEFRLTWDRWERLPAENRKAEEGAQEVRTA